MHTTTSMVTFDVLDAAAEARWWAQVLDGEAVDHDGFSTVRVPDGAGLPLGFQQVADPTPGKNRVHLDLEVDDEAEAVAGLLARGAVLVQEVQMSPEVRWTVLADPEGLQFCVAAR